VREIAAIPERRFLSGTLGRMFSIPVLMLDLIEDRLGGRGAVVTPKDFLEIARRDAVDQALRRLARMGVLERLGHGLYHYPGIDFTRGVALPPDPDLIAAAIGRQTGSVVMPSCAPLARELGLRAKQSDMPEYETTGRSRVVRAGEQPIRLKRVSARRMPNATPIVACALAVLRDAGPDPGDTAIAAMRMLLTPEERTELLKHARSNTSWLAAAATRVAG
jgi:hypothetical protein